MITVVVVAFGIRLPPHYPSLYDRGPVVAGTVAYVEQDGNECLNVLDVAGGEKRTLVCSAWMYLEGWDREGNLVIHSAETRDRPAAIDPATGEVLIRGGSSGVLAPAGAERLQTSSRNGLATLVLHGTDADTTLIDAKGPRDYSFWSAGLVATGDYAWVVDSENRLLLVAIDGGGPWVVLTDVRDVSWR